MININENFFDNIDTEEKAYWLGFIWADGYSAKKSPWFLCIQIKDVDHLEKFCKAIQFEGRIAIPRKSGGYYTENKMGRISICRKYICDRINSLGRNNIPMSIPDIPDELKRHFLRGYFDGDGSVYTYYKRCLCKRDTKSGPKIYDNSYNKLEVSIIGEISYLNQIENFLNENGIIARYKKSKSEYVSYLVVSNKEPLKKLFELFYNDSNVYMNRKFNLWNNFYNAPNSSNTIKKIPNMLETPKALDTKV